MRRIFIILFFSIHLPSYTFCQAPSDTLAKTPNKWLPSMAKLQFAGNIGVLSAGAGYSYLKNRCQSILVYGFTPAFLSGRNISALGIRNSIVPVDIKAGNFLGISPYGGVAVSWSGYFPLQVIPHLGARLLTPLKGRINGVDIYVETTSTTRELDYFFKNRSVRWSSILDVALGTTFYF